SAGSPLLVSDGKKLLADFREAGDEALLLSRVPGLQVAVSKNRAHAIQMFGENSQYVILDDAFQNPSIFRNHDLVLIDATIPPEKVKVFPSGHFRDGLNSLLRADTILLTRTDFAGSVMVKRWKETIQAINGDIRIFESVHKLAGVFPKLKSREVGAFAGIGNPDSFYRSCEKLGLRILNKFSWPDHHIFTEKDICLLKSWNLPLVTTEKDAIRFSEDPSAHELKLHVLKIEMLVKNEKEFIKRVLGGNESWQKRKEKNFQSSWK
ncbi:MAG: tetraacyldisaccharide 4'-kinase, partial [Spirochaetia bacterium]|nr:tetraacyldisaccharide 4'-kinase [Spirochaetia bacterium]